MKIVSHVMVCISLGLLWLLSSCHEEDADKTSSSNPETKLQPTTPSSIKLRLTGRYSSGIYDASAAEIPAFDADSRRVFVVNAQLGQVDVLTLVDPTQPTKIGTLSATSLVENSTVNSVAVHKGIVALAVQAAIKTDPGLVVFYRASDLQWISQVAVGAQPDMLTFTPDGDRVLVANEGEPSADYQTDPEGSISVIDLGNINQPTVKNVDFSAWNGLESKLLSSGIRIYGPNASTAQDLEPESIAISADGRTAWVTLQENNALAKLDVQTATVTKLVSLSEKDHGISGNELDVSDKSDSIDIRTFPGLRGLYQPDGIKHYTAGGQDYLVTANEGDARSWVENTDAYWEGDASLGFVEEFRVEHLVHSDGFSRRLNKDLAPQLDALADGALLNPDIFAWCGASATTAGNCGLETQLGRLKISWTMGYGRNDDNSPTLFNAQGEVDPAGHLLRYDQLYAFGARSFAIWNGDGLLVWDSGAEIENWLASENCKLGPNRDIPCKNFFNSDNDKGNDFDSRSDAKGPEPEGVEIGVIGEKTYAFIGLERMGGVLVYDISNPQEPHFQDYYNTRADWTTKNPNDVLVSVGDLGPEGLCFVPAAQSPNGKPLLIVAHEVSGTTAIYDIEQSF